MTALVDKLPGFLRLLRASGGIQVSESEQFLETAATDIIVPAVIVQEYQSIMPLAGKYADAPFMKNFSEFLEEYREEISDINVE